MCTANRMVIILDDAYFQPFLLQYKHCSFLDEKNGKAWNFHWEHSLTLYKQSQYRTVSIFVY